MGRNLTNLYISSSFEFLTQISGSELQTGLGNTITGSLDITASLANTATSASQAVSASYSNTSTSASYAAVATSSSYAINASNAVSASFAVTASYALNAGATVNTGSLLVTASAVNNVITFTKGDGSTFPVTVATGSTVSSSFASTASLALNNVLTASNTNATITYTKGDGTTFTNVINNVVNATSASVATSASYAISASQAQNAVSASYYGGSVVSASYATTASFAENIASGLSPTFANVTASNVMITGTASVALLHTTTISSSVIFSSGSNLLGDSSTLDTQTLIGIVKTSGSFSATGSAGFTDGDFKVTDQTRNAEFDVDFFKVKTQSGTQFTGSVSISGSFNVTGSVTGNVVGNNTDIYTSSAAVQQIVTLTQAEYNAISASANPNTFYVISDSTAFNPSNYATTGSNTFSGSQVISGSLSITGSQVITGSLRGNVSALSISSQTASLDLSTGNFFTLQLVSGSNTFINPTNIQPGQTINLRVNTTGSGTVSFPTSVLQVSGSSYTPTTTTGVDIVTFISFDSTNLYLSNVKNLI